MEVLWFGCYRVIIWFLSGKNESKWFLLFSLSDILFVSFVCAIFSVRFTQIYYHVTKELCAWSITPYTFHAHCCVIYQRTITQDTDVFREDENFIKFPSKIVCFCHFLWKVIRQPHFLYFVILKYLAYVNIRKINEAFVTFWSTLILICRTSRINTFVNCGHLKKNFTAPWLTNLVEYSYLLPKYCVKILWEKKWAFSFYFTFCKRGILHVSLWRVAL